MKTTHETNPSIGRRVVCAIEGHDWEWGLPSGHSWCRRCRRYDDNSSLLRGDRRRAAIRRWAPIWVSLTRRNLSVLIGCRSFALDARLHFGFARSAELPGLNLTLTLWRLRIWAGIGSGWHDEDGEGRSFAGLNATFTTYGLRWIGCWFGHKPTSSSTFMPGYVSCERCDQELERADAHPRKAAAA